MSWARSALVLGLALASTAPARSQVASLVADLATGPSTEDAPTPGPFFAVGRHVVFVDRTSSSGLVLWGSDGTREGTEVLLSPCPGCSQGFERFVPAGRRWLFFLGAGEPSGPCGARPPLWRTDGTRAGTFRVTDCDVSVWPEALAATENGLFFYGRSTKGEQALWHSDGTREGTRPLAQLPESARAGFSLRIVALGERVLFFGPGDDGPALWASDGTAAGTGVVASFREETTLCELVGEQERVYLLAGRREGLELWTSNGTAAGTVPLRLFSSRGDGREPVRWLRPIGRHAWLLSLEGSSLWQLWTSDGTPAGTRPATHLPPLAFDSLDTLRDRLAPAGERWVLAATLETGESELWATDGTAESTEKLDVCPGRCSGVPAGRPGEPRPLLAVAGRAYFAGRDRERGEELWETDGTREGTRPVGDLCGGDCGEASSLLALPEALLFVARHAERGRAVFRYQVEGGRLARVSPFGVTPGVVPFGEAWAIETEGRTVLGAQTLSGAAVFASDSSPEGTRLLARLGTRAASSEPANLFDLSDRLVLSACEPGVGRALWAAWGWPLTLERLAQLPADPLDPCAPLAGAWRLRPTGPALFLTAGSFAQPAQLWASDGTAAGTVRLAASSQIGFVGASRLLGVVDGEGLLAWADEGVDRVEVLRTDGTPAGTGGAFTLPVDLARHLEAALSFEGALLLVTGDPDETGLELWRLDPASGALTRLTRFPASYPFPATVALVPFEGRLFFLAGEEAGDHGLWTTDGTPEGTRREVPLPVAFVPVRRPPMREHLGQLFFFAPAAEEVLGLWVSDGTPAGTRLLRGFRVPADGFGFAAGPLAAVDHRLVFAATDSAHGTELWATDGTAEGTHLVADLWPGPGSSRPVELVETEGRVLFAATDPTFGTELWATDGTAEGTRRAHDLAPGPAGSVPEHFTTRQGRLFFAADDGRLGRELWSLPLGSDGPRCEASAFALCLAGGRFRAEVTWTGPDGAPRLAQARPLTGTVGAFSFHSEESLEVFAKLLDGRRVNRHFWLFQAALTDLEHTLTVTDTETGRTRSYPSPAGALVASGDVEAFEP